MNAYEQTEQVLIRKEGETSRLVGGHTWMQLDGECSPHQACAQARI